VGAPAVHSFTTSAGGATYGTATLWCKAGQRSLARSALVEAFRGLFLIAGIVLVFGCSIPTWRAAAVPFWDYPPHPPVLGRVLINPA